MGSLGKEFFDCAQPAAVLQQQESPVLKAVEMELKNTLLKFDHSAVVVVHPSWKPQQIFMSCFLELV